MADNIVQALVDFAENDLDQWYAVCLPTKYGKVYVWISPVPATPDPQSIYASEEDYDKFYDQFTEDDVKKYYPEYGSK